MYELKDLKEPLMDFTDHIGMVNQSFMEELENNPTYADSLIFAGILYEYKRIDANFHSRSFAAAHPEVPDKVKGELTLQEFADFLQQNPQNAKALQEALIKHGGFSSTYFMESDETMLTKEQIAENIRERFDEIIGVVQDSAKPTLECIEKYQKAIKAQYFETLAKYGINEPVICRGSPTDIPKGMNIPPAIDTENQFTNEIVTGVFATSSYDGVSRYIAKGVVPGGVSMGSGIDIFPQGTFLPAEKQTDPDNLMVAGSSNIYVLPADSFEPQVDFEYSPKNGKPKLLFRGEWVAKGEEGISILSKQSIDRIDRNLYEDRSVFERRSFSC
ncbi:MAG: hypothetical protein IJ215_01465 [Clostridia bacterium]|nr:hypothetical protein [Clostridia bacterium]